MRLLQVLLARASFAIVLFICVMTNRDQRPWFFLFMFMFCYSVKWITNLTRSNWIRKCICLLTPCHQILLLRVFLYEQEGFELLLENVNYKTVSQFINDNALPFFQYRQTLTYIYMEIKNVFVYIWKCFEKTGIRPVKCFKYLLRICLHALFLSFVADRLFITLYSEVCNVIINNFMAYDASIETPHPEAFLFMEHFDFSDYKSPVSKEMFYTKTSSFDRSNWINGTEKIYFVNSQPIDGLLFYGKISRYPGEDVKMDCSILVSNIKDRDLINHEVYWTLNDKRIRNTSRIFYHTAHETFNDNANRIFSELTVLFLKKSDFGEYKCIQDFTYDTVYFSSNTKNVKAVYNLEQVYEKIFISKRNVGSLSFSPFFYLYHMTEDITDVYAEYTVNEQTVDEVCAGPTYRFCSIGAMILLNILNVDFNNYPFSRVERYLEYPDLKRAFISFCMCSKGYGVHRVTFIRKLLLYNGKTKWVDVKYPFVLIILPNTKTSLFRNFDDSELYKDIENMLSNETNLTVIQKMFLDVDIYIDSNEYKTLIIANILQICIIIFTTVPVTILILAFSSFYCRTVIGNSFNNYFFCLSLIDSESQILYDVFLSHSDAEYVFVRDKLLPFIETQCEQKVCFPERDFERGNPEIGLYEKHITESRKVIVLLSTEYHRDPYCQHLQLDCILLPMLIEKKRTKADVLFIMYDQGARLPNVLKRDFQKEKINWQKHLPDKTKLSAVKKWLQAENVS